jgi:hypothetical protein
MRQSSTVNPFETETMAELHLRQGHREEALAIYRRLLARTTDEAARARMLRRIAGAEGADVAADSPLLAEGGKRSVGWARSAADPEIPSVSARLSGNEVTVEWRLPPGTPTPAVEVLLVSLGSAGVISETRTIEVDRDRGQLVLRVADLHSARAAAGRRAAGGGFIPIVRG